MAWRIYATAQVTWPERAGYPAEAHATLYQIPGGGFNLRAKAGEELLLDGVFVSVSDALLEAAFSELPQRLYDALIDAVARRGDGEP